MNQQSKRNLTNKIISLAGIMVFVFFIAIYVSACSNYLKGNRTRRKLFGATYMTMNNEFYKVVNNQIRMQVEKNGDEMITLDPALDQKKQNEQIKQLVKRKVDAIFLNSVDWKEVESGKGTGFVAKSIKYTNKYGEKRGFRFRYSTSKKMKSAKYKTTGLAKNVYTKTGLKKGKKYYVQVRYYYYDSTNQKVYGTYSKAKSVKAY